MRLTGKIMAVSASEPVSGLFDAKATLLARLFGEHYEVLDNCPAMKAIILSASVHPCGVRRSSIHARAVALVVA